MCYIKYSHTYIHTYILKQHCRLTYSPPEGAAVDLGSVQPRVSLRDWSQPPIHDTYSFGIYGGTDPGLNLNRMRWRERLSHWNAVPTIKKIFPTGKIPQKFRVIIHHGNLSKAAKCNTSWLVTGKRKNYQVQNCCMVLWVFLEEMLKISIVIIFNHNNQLQ